MKKKNKILLLIVIFVIILLILLSVLNLQKSKKVNNNTGNNTEETTYFENSDIDKLSGMTEKERITFYFAKYIENIENGDFDTAYNMLYDEFRNTYFKTIDDFESYVTKKYPEIISVNYKSFVREGVYYIVSVEIQDITNNSSFEQKFIIREYDYNNFVMSFQAE